ncbi:MAG: hypothetical protein FJ358_00645 [Thaumarchaeota archaeon]|nr:hypothetical protein [Nitrososphaerota archaeon]
MPKLPKDVKKFAEMFGSAGGLKPASGMRPLRPINVEIFEDGKSGDTTVRCTACNSKFNPLEDDYQPDTIEKHLRVAHRGKYGSLIWVEKSG